MNRKSISNKKNLMKSNNTSEKSLSNINRVPSIKNIETSEQRAKKKLEGITFEDIQKMHYSNLN